MSTVAACTWSVIAPRASPWRNSSAPRYGAIPRYSPQAGMSLARVAWLLECSPEQLAATGKLTNEDAEQCSIAAPYLAVELIRSNGWTSPPPIEPGPRLEQPAPPSAPRFSATWCAARDAYLGHLMKCPDCIAHRLHNTIHCEARTVLRRGYDVLSGS